jgi:hypothetical protein
MRSSIAGRRTQTSILVLQFFNEDREVDVSGVYSLDRFL